MTIRSTSRLVAAAALIAVGAASGAAAQGTGPQPGWSFEITPYAWLPTVGADLRYRLPSDLAGTAKVRADPGDYTSNLNAAAAFAASVRYDRFSLLTDFMYVSASAGSSRVDAIDIVDVGRNPISSVASLGVDSTLKTTLWTLAGGYTLASGPWGHVDGLAGFRYLGIESKTNYNLALQLYGPRGNAGPSFGGAGRLSGDDDIWNGIVGLRGRLRLGGGGFFVPYHVDIGTGDSNLTWQALAGLGYQTGPVGVSLGWRYLSYDQGGSALVQNLTLSGAFLAVNFNF